jgi:hypothetical protein
MICAIVGRSDGFRAKVRFRVFLIRQLTRGTPSTIECARPAKFFQQAVPRRISVSTICQIFEQCSSVPEQPKTHYHSLQRL